MSEKIPDCCRDAMLQLSSALGAIEHLKKEIEKRSWQPIETAPRDGTKIFLIQIGWLPFLGLFDTSPRVMEFVRFTSQEIMYPDLTHWAPIPEVPK